MEPNRNISCLKVNKISVADVLFTFFDELTQARDFFSFANRRNARGAIFGCLARHLPSNFAAIGA